MKPYLRLALSILFVPILAIAASAALRFPAFTGMVVDDAGILSAETSQRLDAMLTEYQKQSGNQVVVATLKDIGDTDIRDYGYQLGRAWGVGQKGKDNGVVILVAPNQHRVSIEVGYGLEGTLTDAQSKLITENVMKPAFKSGDYDKGVLEGTVDVLRALGGNPTGTESIPQPQRHESGGGIPIFVIVLIVWIVFGRFLWPLLFLGGIGRGGWGGGGWSGGGGGWSSGGGGFSGGGGGSFGGGGASSSW